MTIDATVGGTSSNSYVTLLEAEAYFANHPSLSTWDAATNQEEMLLYAAILLDSVVNWYGAKYDEDQAMECPRTTFTDVEAIPKQIKYAQIELALHLITNGASFTPDNSIDKLEVGPISIDFNQPTGESNTMLPPIVQTMLAQYGSVRRSGNTANTVGLVRV